MYKDTLIGDYVTLYGICIAVGIVLCIFLLRWVGKKSGVDKKFLDFVEVNGYIAILVGFFFSAVFQAFYDFIETGVFDLFNSGITFIGGLIGGVAAFLIGYALFRKKLTGKIVDILPIAPACITIAHGFGRVGCFFAGCCGDSFANPSDPLYFLAVKFPEGMQYPVQLYEAFVLFALTAIIVILILKKNFKYGFSIYLAVYGVWRFFIEYVRGDSRGELIPGLTPSQFWSIIMVLGAVPVYFLLKYLLKTRNNGAETNLITEEASNAASNEEKAEENI